MSCRKFPSFVTETPLALHCYTECIAHLDQITYFEVHCIASWYIAEFMATALSLLNSLHWSVLIAIMYWYNCPIVLERCWAVDAIMHCGLHWLCICVTPALAWYLVTQSHSYALVAGSSSKHNGVFYTLSVYFFKEDTVLSWIITNATCWQTVKIIVKIPNPKIPSFESLTQSIKRSKASYPLQFCTISIRSHLSIENTITRTRIRSGVINYSADNSSSITPSSSTTPITTKASSLKAGAKGAKAVS